MPLPENIEDVRKRTFEKEHELGVSREDHPVLKKLSELQYLFVLVWCDPNFIVTNKSQWAQEHGFRRQDVYEWVSANPRTTEAIAYLNSKLNQNLCVQLSKVVFRKAMEGNMSAARMFLEHFKAAEILTHDSQTEDAGWDLTYQWKKPEGTPAPTTSDQDKTDEGKRLDG